MLSCPLEAAAQPVTGQPLADSTVWERLGTTKQEAITWAFSGDPAEPTVWVGDPDIYRLDAPSGEWVLVKLTSAGEAILFLGPKNPVPDTILAGGSQRSVDGGRTWTQGTWADTGGLFFGGPGLAEAPAGSPFAGRVFAGNQFSRPGERFTSQLGYSTDRAATWHAPAAQTRMEIAELVALRSGRVVTAGFLGAALSDDGGDTFRPIPELHEASFARYDHQAIEVLPGFTPRATDGGSSEGRLMVVGGDAGDGRAGFVVHVSDDEGDSWRRAALIPTTVDAIGGLAAVPEEVGGAPGWAILTHSNGPVWATVDGGETWTAIGVVPQTGAYPLPESPRNTVKALAVGPDGRLYAGVARQGPETWWSWRTKGRVADAVRRAVASEAAAPGEAPSLGVLVRPNPTRDRAEIVLTLMEALAVRVTAFDVQGREVVVLLDGAVPAGERRLGVDTADWPAGVYVVRASAGSEVTVARVVVTR